MIRSQFALYPLNLEGADDVIAAALDDVRAQDVDVVVGRMSSELRGESSEVFAALKAAFDRTAGSGEVAMTVTISNAC